MRTTVAAPIDVVWEFLLGAGLPVWLGEIDALPEEKGAAYSTADGVSGTIRSRTDGLRVRLFGGRATGRTIRPCKLPTVKSAATGTTIGFHHEHLADREERRMMLGHWKNAAAAPRRALRRWLISGQSA